MDSNTSPFAGYFNASQSPQTHIVCHEVAVRHFGIGFNREALCCSLASGRCLPGLALVMRLAVKGGYCGSFTGRQPRLVTPYLHAAPCSVLPELYCYPPCCVMPELFYKPPLQSLQVLRRELSSFDSCSLTNIDSGDNKLWVHAVSLYVVTLIVLRVRRNLAPPSAKSVTGVRAQVRFSEKRQQALLSEAGCPCLPCDHKV